jgi:hypothetical protein
VVVTQESRVCYATRAGQETKLCKDSGGKFCQLSQDSADANVWSEKLLFDHLAYAAMRCNDQGYVTLDQLFSPIELGVQASVQQVAQYKEEALIQWGPARDAFVATVSQQLADRLQDCCKFIKGGQSWASGHQLPL